MAFKDLFVRKIEHVKENAPLIIGTNSTPTIQEAMKGEVEIKEAQKWYGELGEEHPFNFADTEGIYKKYGFVTGVIDKFTDFIIGPGFEIKIVNEQEGKSKETAEEIISNFRRDYNLDLVLRKWIKEALIKGNGFLELGIDKTRGITGFKLLNANYMYVKRNNVGDVEGYNQYTGSFNRGVDKNRLISFKPSEIAHLTINQISDSAYGLGKIYSAMKILDNLMCLEKNMNMLMERKANVPFDVTLGNLEAKRFPTDGDITAFGQKLEWLHNKHEWVHGPDVTMKTLDFGSVGDKFEFALKHNLDMLFFTFQVPEVLMGRGSIPEGLAKVQMQAFKMTCQSIQDEIENIIEKQIIKRVLIANGFDMNVEINWLPASDDEKNARIALLQSVAGSFSSTMTTMIEEEVVNLLGFDYDEYELLKRKELDDRMTMKDMEKEKEDEEEIIPPTTKKQETIILKGSYKTCGCNECLNESFLTEDQDYELQEFVGFNFLQQKAHILKIIALDRFEDLRAFTKKELAVGYLTKEATKELKNVMLEAFSDGKSVNWIKNQLVENNIVPPLMKEDIDGNLVEFLNQQQRAYIISRTETVRLANKGNLDYYAQTGTKQVRFNAAISERTCEECSSRNGEILSIDESEGIIPLHVMCRCRFTAVVEGLND